jgi:hypothetical protein
VQDRKIIDELTARTGLDPFRQIHRVVAAFPDDAQALGAFALVFDGEGFDEKRLLTYARDQARLKGADIQQRAHAGRTLWASTSPGGASGFFVGSGRFVLGGGGWTELVSERLDGPGGLDATLTGLIQRVGAKRALWLAAFVPDATRNRLASDPRFGPQSSVMRLGIGADFAPGLTADVVAELSNAADARVMVQKLETFVREAKKNPQVLLLGAGPYLDALSVRADGPHLRMRLDLSEAQTADLASRLAGLARLSRKPGRAGEPR